jgi:hypothetical protein
MDNETASRSARPRLNSYTRALRRERIFSHVQLGASSTDIAREEGLSEQRVRKIVADALKRQAVDDPRDYALLQLVRLESAHDLAARTIAAGNLKAIAPYLKVLDRLDRYRKTTGAAKKVYDDDARARLFAKINRTAAWLKDEVRKSPEGNAAEPRLRPDAENEPDSELNL